ncbi:MAG: V-type ATPase subunit [Acholeplasmataceae bacterium]|nr:V-type ATPase subunit [Acholeplasmataceae bacterium]
MDYPFAIGVIKAIEDRLFDKAKYAKLNKTPKSEMAAMLSSFGYGKGATDLSVEGLIQAERRSLREMLDSLSPNRRLTDLFYLLHDATNLKVLYKEKLFGIPHPSLGDDLAAIPGEIMENAVLRQDRQALPKAVQALLFQIDEAIQKVSDNPRLVSVVIDNLLLTFALKQCRFSKAEALRTYLLAFIDFQNVLAIERSRLLGWSIAVTSEMLLDNGSIPKPLFLEAMNQSRDIYLRALQDFYHEKLSNILKKNQGEGNIETLEKALESLLLDQVKPFRNDAFSIGPIIYYYLKKDAEAKNIRTLFAVDKIDLADLRDL